MGSEPGSSVMAHLMMILTFRKETAGNAGLFVRLAMNIGSFIIKMI
jgi:hypothetical protein